MPAKEHREITIITMVDISQHPNYQKLCTSPRKAMHDINDNMVQHEAGKMERKHKQISTSLL